MCASNGGLEFAQGFDNQTRTPELPGTLDSAQVNRQYDLYTANVCYLKTAGKTSTVPDVVQICTKTIFSIEN